MILQDKAKEDFLEWYGADEKYFESTATKTEEYANIIEWLDSVGIYIILFMKDDDWRVEIRHGYSVYFKNNFNSRQEATKASIEKANEIYNTQHFAQ